MGTPAAAMRDLAQPLEPSRRAPAAPGPQRASDVLLDGLAVRFTDGIRAGAPILKLALADKPPIPFKVPAGIKLVRVDAKSGMRAGPGDGGRTILEAFKPGTAPPDNYSVIGVADADGRVPAAQTPDAGNIMRPGTGGLY